MEKESGGFFHFFTLFSSSCCLQKTTNRSPLWQFQTGEREGEKRRKGKFISSLPIPLYFPLPLLSLSMYDTVYFVQDGIILNAKSFKGGQILGIGYTRAGPPCLPSFFKQTEIRTKLKEWQLKSHKRRNLASGL